MSAGHPLTDEDRWPWLQAIADEIDRLSAAGERAVIACSALKRAYRDILVHGRDDVRIVFLDGTQDLIAARLAARKGHFMPPGLLASQLKTLERPGSERAADHCIDRRAGRGDRGRHRQSIEPGSPMTRIALVVSDVDGTLLTKDKILTDGAKAAVRKLHEAGIGFTIVSSRPTIGMGFLIEPLSITLPVGAFNGSSIVDDKLRPIEQHLIAACGGAAQPRRAQCIRRRYLAVHQRPLVHAQSRRRIRPAREAGDQGRIRPSSRISPRI